MNKCLVLSKHTLTPPQIQELQTDWLVEKFIYLDEVQKLKWGNISPLAKSTEIVRFVKEDVLNWIRDTKPNIVVMLGEHGAVAVTAFYLQLEGIIALYPVKKRLPTGAFTHFRFRRHPIQEVAKREV